MAKLPDNYTPADYPDTGKTIPEGEYTCMVTDSGERKSKSNPNHTYVYLKVEVMEGEYKGKYVDEILCFDHPDNQKARRIAREKLASYCRAVDVPNPRDTQDLHHKPFVVPVAVKKSEWQGETRYQNNLKRPRKVAEAVAAKDREFKQANQGGGLPWQK